MGAETNTPADGREVDFFEALTGMVVDINHEVTKGMEEVGAVPETAGVVDEVLYKNWGIEQCDMVIEETSGSATGIVIGAIAGVSLAQSMDRREFMAGAGTGGALLGAGGMESAHAENLKFAPVKMTLTTTAEGGKAGTLEVDVYHYDSSKGQFAMTRTGTKKGGFFIGFERFDEGSKEQLRRHMVKQALTKHPERMSNKQGFEIVAGTRFTNKDLHVNYHYSGLKKSINPKVVSPLFALSEHVGAKKPDSYLGRNRWDDDTMSFLSEIAAPEIDGLKRERDKEYAILASAEAEATAAAEAEKIDATGRETAPGFPTEGPIKISGVSNRRKFSKSVQVLNVHPATGDRPIQEFCIKNGDKYDWYSLNDPRLRTDQDLKSKTMVQIDIATFDALTEILRGNLEGMDVHVFGWDRDFHVLNDTEAFKGRKFIEVASTPDAAFAVEEGTGEVRSTAFDGALMGPDNTPLKKVQRLEVCGMDTLLVYCPGGFVYEFSGRKFTTNTTISDCSNMAMLAVSTDYPLPRRGSLTQVAMYLRTNAPAEESGSESSEPTSGSTPERPKRIMGRHNMGCLTVNQVGKLEHHWGQEGQTGNKSESMMEGGVNVSVDLSVLDSVRSRVKFLESADGGDVLVVTTDGPIVLSPEIKNYKESKKKGYQSYEIQYRIRYSTAQIESELKGLNTDKIVAVGGGMTTLYMVDENGRRAYIGRNLMKVGSDVFDTIDNRKVDHNQGGIVFISERGNIKTKYSTSYGAATYAKHNSDIDLEELKQSRSPRTMWAINEVTMVKQSGDVRTPSGMSSERRGGNITVALTKPERMNVTVAKNR